MKSLRAGPLPSCLVLALALSAAASASSPVAACHAELQHLARGSGAEDALRACVPLFKEPGCQRAWTELLDAPRASPGYGRGVGIARLSDGCVKAYCRYPGMGRQQLCTGKTPTPLSAEFFAAWRSFENEVLQKGHVPKATSERLVHALVLWAGFSPRPGTRHVLQAVTRPDVPGVVALTLWSAHGERLGAWVTDVIPDEVTLRSLEGSVPPPGEAQASTPCVRLEAPASLPRATVAALLEALRTVCPADMVTVSGGA